LVKQLVKIPHAKQQQSVATGRFGVCVLSHHGALGHVDIVTIGLGRYELPALQVLKPFRGLKAASFFEASAAWWRGLRADEACLRTIMGVDVPARLYRVHRLRAPTRRHMWSNAN
jgi:hypothetical protein